MTEIAKYNGMMSYLTRPPAPQTQVADLVDDLEPGALKDELKEKFDPSQETYEEYLRRERLGERPFNASNGGSPKEEIVEPSKSMQMDTTTSNPIPEYNINDFRNDAEIYVLMLHNNTIPRTDIADKLNNFAQKGVDAGTFTMQDAGDMVRRLMGEVKDRAQKQRLRDVIIEGTGTVQRDNKAIGGGVIEGEDLGTREGFAGVKQVKNVAKFEKKFPDVELGDYYFDTRNPDYAGPGKGDSPRITMGPYKTKKEAQAAFNKRQKQAIQSKTQQFRDRKTLFDKHAQEINNFVTDFYNENVTKYGLRDYDSFEKAFLKAYKESGIKDIKNGRRASVLGFPNVGKFGVGRKVTASKSPLTLFNIDARTASGVNTARDAQAFFVKAFYAGQIEKNPQLLQNLKRYFEYFNIDKKFYKGTKLSREDLKKQYADVLDPSVKSDLLYLLESEDIGTGKLRGGYIKAFLPKEYEAYQKKKNNANLRYQRLLKEIEASMPKKALKEALDGDTSIKRFMTRQTDLLNKIFDTSPLKDAGSPELIFNADHLEGIAEIARMKNVKDKIRGLKNVVGTTAERNYELGMFGYSKNRQDLITKINKKTNVDKNVKKLNDITKIAYPEFKGDLYQYNPATKSVVPTKNFTVEYTPETAFKQYFRDLIKSPVGLKELQKQYKNNPGLQKIVQSDPDLFSKVDPKDLTNVQKVIRKMQNQMNSGMDPKLLVEYLGAEMKDIAAFGQKYGGDVLGKVGKGLTGVDLPIFQVMFGSMYDIEQDSPLWLTIPAAFTDEVSNIFGLYEKSKGKFGLGKVKDFGKFLASSLVPQKFLGKAIRSPFFKTVSKVGKAGTLAGPLLEAGAGAYRFEKMKDARDDAIRQFNIPIEVGNKAFDDYIRSTVPQDSLGYLDVDVDKGTAPVPESPGLEGLMRGIKQFGSMVGLADDPYAIQKVRGDVTGTGLTSPMALQRLYDRQGLVEGGPPDPKRRMILKMLGLIPAGIAGLASLRFGPKKVKKVIDTVKTAAAKGKPKWFDALVNKVIRMGDDVTERFATRDREIVHQTNIGDNETVRVYRDLETDSVRVEYESPDNMLEEPVDLEYKRTPPDESNPKGSVEFEVTESGFVGKADGPDDYFVDAEPVGGTDIKDLDSDVSKLKEFATGQKPTMKEIVKNKKRKDKVRRLNEGDLDERSQYITDRQGDYVPDPGEPDF